MGNERTRDRARERSPESRRRARRPPTERRPRLRATVVEYETGPDKCTLSPIDPDEDSVTTTWLTANRGAFVSLADWR